MQTQLKKEAQKFSKWNRFKNSTKNSTNKAKLQIAKKETSLEKEKYLRGKILNIFKETYKSIKQKSGPELDTKGIIKKHGLSLCDYEQKNFYSAKMLPVIAYGYLMRAGNLTITENEKKQIETELNGDIKTSNTEQIELKDYKIQNNVKQTKEATDHKINSSDITSWIEIGKTLYTSTEYPPTEADVLNAIRKNGKSVATCPFSQGKWNETHNFSKEVNSGDGVQDDVKKKADAKENKNNTLTNLKNNESKEQTSTVKIDKKLEKKSEKCDTDNCPHKEVKGRAPWIKVAEEEMNKYKGQKESSRSLYNRIQKTYFPYANFGTDKKPTKIAWCAAFVTYCMKTAGYKNSSYPSVGGYDWGVAPRPKLPKRGWFEGEKTKPFVGAIGIFKFRNGYSHVAILVGKRKNGMYVFLGGNQNDEINLLISKADEVRNEIYNAYRANGENINPLVLIQFPSLSDDMITQVEKALELRGYTYENRMVASWFSAESQADKDKHSKKLDKINIGNVGDPDSITRHDAKPCFLLFKQALATGWDCPRAKVLVKLRDNMNETFEIQTLGRLRRMPNAIHYGTDTLDCAYLYTLDEKYKEAVINDGSGYEVRRVFIKPDAKSIKIHKEYIDNNRNYIDMKIARKLLYQYFVDKFSLLSLINNPNGEKSNRDILEAHGFIFGTKLHREYLSARLRTLNELIEATNNSIIKFEVDTHKHGMLMRHEIGRFSKILGLDYDNTRTLVRTLFMGGNARTAALAYKILPLEIREYYAFIINNKNLLYELFVEFERNTASLSSVPVQGQLYIPIKEEVSSILSEEVYPVDSRGQIINFIKNVYEKYDSSMVDSFRSTSEKLFEKYCESLDNVKFIYKNGDKGVNYISIIYQMVFGKARSFYPDYLVQMSDGTIWIIETKGGETKSGQDKNIDIEAKHKFDALVVYAKKYNLKYGFVRDKNTDLYINTTDKWVDDLSDTSVWKRIETVLK